MRERGAGAVFTFLTQRTPAIAAACVGWAAALGCAAMTVKRGWAWLVPMGLLLAFGNAPLLWLLWGARMRLRNALGRIPARRYRLPLGGTVEGSRPVEMASDHHERIRTWSVHMGVSQVGTLERLVLRTGSAFGRSAIRVRYPGAPFLAALPCITLAAGANRETALTWSGSEGLLVAEADLASDSRSGPDREASYEGALQALETADARRVADLELLGGLHAVAREGPTRILTEAEYEAVGVVPLATASDFLTLMELEFAAPWGEGIRSEPRNVEGADGRTSFEGVFVSGRRRLPGDAGSLIAELVLVRLSEDALAAFARRTTLPGARGDATE